MHSFKHTFETFQAVKNFVRLSRSLPCSLQAKRKEGKPHEEKQRKRPTDRQTDGSYMDLKNKYANVYESK